MNENIPTSTNNPGDLMFAGQAGATPVTKQTNAGPHTFAQFATPQAGFGALLNQISLNIKNKPNETIADWANTYAPPSDGNDTGSYIEKLSNQMGVSPATPISQLQPRIGQFADAVAKNEGYQMNTTPTNTPTAQSSTSGSQPQGGFLNGAEALGGAALTGLGGLLGGVRSALPEIGAIGGAALAPETGGLSEILMSGLGSAVGSGVQNLTGGNTQSQQNQQQPTDNSLVNPGVSAAINDALSQTVKGSALSQEAQNRGLGDIGAAMQQEKAVPSVNQNGDYEKIPSALILNAKNGQDANAVEQLAAMMPSQSNISDVLGTVESSLAGILKNTGEAEKMRGNVAKELNGLVQDKSAQTGKELSASQTFLSPSDWLEYRRHLSRQINKRSGAAYALPDDQRSALTHIERGVAKHLSNLAHINGKGEEWDKLHKDMERRFMLKKALAAMPKKAQRDFKRELLHDVISSVAGGILGRVTGNGPVGELIGGVGGHLISRKLGKRYYKTLEKKSSKRLEQRQKNGT